MPPTVLPLPSPLTSKNTASKPSSAAPTASKPSSAAPAKSLPSTTAARLVAAEKGRTVAQCYRSKPHSVDAIRAMVKAQMKQESEESRQRTLAKLAVEEQLAQQQQHERQAVRSEARRVYQSELWAQEQQATVPPPEAAAALNIASEPPAESGAARVEALLRERADRIKADIGEVKALRERVAARRYDSSQWAMPSAAPVTTHSENRSLFTWRPPALTTERAETPAVPAAAARSEAARDAWSWVQRADATFHIAPQAAVGEE